MASMSYYEDDASAIKRPPIWRRIVVVIGAAVPILTAIFLIVWFIRVYISPPMVKTAPVTQAARNIKRFMSQGTEALHNTMPTRGEQARSPA